MDKAIYAVTLVVVCLGVAAVYFAFRMRRRAVSDQARIVRVFEAANRSLELIEDENPNEILVGLQMLSVYDIPSIHIKALPRLIRLTQHDNRQVAELARRVIEISQSQSNAQRRTAAGAS